MLVTGIAVAIASAIIWTGMAAWRKILYRIYERIHQRVRASEGRFRAMVNSSTVTMVVAADNQGNIVFWNRAAEKVFGYSAPEVLHRPLSILMPERYGQPASSGFAGLLSSGNHSLMGQTVEIYALKKNGHEFPVELSLGTWCQGGERYFSAVMHDITQRKKAEERNREAGVEVERANRAKTEFLTNMSHELRTPLNAIIGFSQIMQINPEEPLTKAQSAAVHHINNAGQHLLKLIDDLLDMSKIENGKVDLKIEDTALESSVSNCIALIQTLSDQRGICIEFSPDMESKTVVQVDPVRLEQVLLNLLSNAIKYNYENGWVGIDIEKMRNDCARVSVSDTGCGIPKEEHGNIFEAFNRLGAESTEVEGTGIGLVISRNIIRLMGGEIGFDNTLKRGSTFWIDVPLATDHATGVPASWSDHNMADAGPYRPEA